MPLPQTPPGTPDPTENTVTEDQTTIHAIDEDNFTIFTDDKSNNPPLFQRRFAHHYTRSGNELTLSTGNEFSIPSPSSKMILTLTLIEILVDQGAPQPHKLFKVNLLILLV